MAVVEDEIHVIVFCLKILLIGVQKCHLMYINNVLLVHFYELNALISLPIAFQVKWGPYAKIF